MATKNLGGVRAQISSTSPPSNTQLIWFNIGDNAYTKFRHYFYNTDTLAWEPLAQGTSSNVVFYTFYSGALTSGVLKNVPHNQGLRVDYMISARTSDGHNNQLCQILEPTSSNPTNSVDIKVLQNISAPGLLIQICGVPA